MTRPYNWKRNKQIYKRSQEGYAHREIADEFEMSHTNVYRVLKLHRKKLKMALKNKD
jgi:Mor family transcriptional regulator